MLLNLFHTLFLVAWFAELLMRVNILLILFMPHVPFISVLHLLSSISTFESTTIGRYPIHSKPEEKNGSGKIISVPVAPLPTLSNQMIE